MRHTNRLSEAMIPHAPPGDLLLVRLLELRAGHPRLADDREQSPGPQLAMIWHRHRRRAVGR